MCVPSELADKFSEIKQVQLNEDAIENIIFSVKLLLG
jgi:hypothetical protein